MSEKRKCAVIVDIAPKRKKKAAIVPPVVVPVDQLDSPIVRFLFTPDVKHVVLQYLGLVAISALAGTCKKLRVLIAYDPLILTNVACVIIARVRAAARYNRPDPFFFDKRYSTCQLFDASPVRTVDKEYTGKYTSFNYMRLAHFGCLTVASTAPLLGKYTTPDPETGKVPEFKYPRYLKKTTEGQRICIKHVMAILASGATGVTLQKMGTEERFSMTRDILSILSFAVELPGYIKKAIDSPFLALYRSIRDFQTWLVCVPLSTSTWAKRALEKWKGEEVAEMRETLETIANDTRVFEGHLKKTVEFFRKICKTSIEGSYELDWNTMEKGTDLQEWLNRRRDFEAPTYPFKSVASHVNDATVSTLDQPEKRLFDYIPSSNNRWCHHNSHRTGSPEDIYKSILDPSSPHDSVGEDVVMSAPAASTMSFYYINKRGAKIRNIPGFGDGSVMNRPEQVGWSLVYNMHTDTLSFFCLHMTQAGSISVPQPMRLGWMHRNASLFFIATGAGDVHFDKQAPPCLDLIRGLEADPSEFLQNLNQHEQLFCGWCGRSHSPKCVYM